MTFAYPYALWLLALIPLLLWLPSWWRSRRAARRGLGVPDLAAVARQGFEPPRINPELWLRLLRAGALAALIVAFARPQHVTHLKVDEHSGVDIMLCVDISASMVERDFFWQSRPVDRLSMVKIVLDQFIAKRPQDRIGLVVFGSEAFLQSPLTIDHKVTRFLVDDLEIGQAGRFTALGDALGVAIKRMKDLPAESKIVVLLTDGADTASQVSPRAMAAIAKEQGIKVYTIAMGSARSQRGFGNPQGHDVDIPTLKGIAETSGGQFFLAENSKALLGIYDEIDRVEKRKAEVATYTETEELYYPYALAGFLLFALELVLSATLLRIIPE